MLLTKFSGVMGQDSTSYLPNEPLGNSTKSVSFNLNERERSIAEPQIRRDYVGEKGYETDDSDSTIDGLDRNQHSHGHRSRRSSVPHHHTTGTNNTSTRNQRPGRPAADLPRDSDSESTIDLPDRFDAQGRKLPEKGDDPLADTMDQFLHDAFMNGKSHSRSTSKAW